MEKGGVAHLRCAMLPNCLKSQKEIGFMEKQTEQKEKKKINIYKLLTVVLAAALVLVLILYGRAWYIQRSALKEYEKLAAEVNTLQEQVNDNAIVVEETQQDDAPEPQEPESETESEADESLAGITIPQKNLDWEKLQRVNADIYAWIYIPGTDIDYPVLQHSSDDSYYLNYNLNGTKGYPGCIYTERANSREFTDFDTVLYGHNMRNDSMFAELHEYEKQDFLDENPYVYIYTGDKVFVYEILTAYKTDDAHILNTNDFSTDAGRVSYLETIAAEAQNGIHTNGQAALSVDSHLLTLSTCVGKDSDKRFLVQAVLLNEDAL